MLDQGSAPQKESDDFVFVKWFWKPSNKLGCLPFLRARRQNSVRFGEMCEGPNYNCTGMLWRFFFFFGGGNFSRFFGVSKLSRDLEDYWPLVQTPIGLYFAIWSNNFWLKIRNNMQDVGAVWLKVLGHPISSDGWRRENSIIPYKDGLFVSFRGPLSRGGPQKAYQHLNNFWARPTLNH